MNSEQLLVNKWRKLPPSKQQEVIDFVEFIEVKILQNHPLPEDKQTAEKAKPKNKLGERLRAIREEIVTSGVALLSAKEIEKEKSDRQGGYQGDS